MASVVVGLLVWRRPWAPIGGPAAEASLAGGLSEASSHEIPATSPAASSTSGEPDPDAELRAKILGRWTMTKHGERIIVNRPDGTASMSLTFDWVASLLYGSEMALELTWALRDERLSYTIVSGVPQENYKKLVKDYGDTATYDFEVIEDRRMHLRETSGDKDLYEWTRLD